MLYSCTHMATVGVKALKRTVIVPWQAAGGELDKSLALLALLGYGAWCERAGRCHGRGYV